MPTFCTHPAHAQTQAQMHYIPNPFSNLHGRLPHLQFGLNQGLSQSMGFFRVAWSLTADWNHEKQSIGVMSGAGSERQNQRAHQQHHPIASSFFLWYVYMYFFEQAQYLKKPLQQVLFRKFSWKSLAGAVFFQPWFGYCWLYMYSSCKLSTLKGSWRHVALSNKDRLPCHMVVDGHKREKSGRLWSDCWSNGSIKLKHQSNNKKLWQEWIRGGTSTLSKHFQTNTCEEKRSVLKKSNFDDPYLKKGLKTDVDCWTPNIF